MANFGAVSHPENPHVSTKLEPDVKDWVKSKTASNSSAIPTKLPHTMCYKNKPTPAEQLDICLSADNKQLQISHLGLRPHSREGRRTRRPRRV